MFDDHDTPVRTLMKEGLCPTCFGAKEPALTPEHVPTLIRMATDESFSNLGPHDPAVFVPALAIDALRQLGAIEAVVPLIEAMSEFEALGLRSRADTIGCEIAKFGIEAIPPIEQGITSDNGSAHCRLALVFSLMMMATLDPEGATAAVEAGIHRLLGAPEPHPPSVRQLLEDNLRLLERQRTDPATSS